MNKLWSTYYSITRQPATLHISVDHELTVSIRFNQPQWWSCNHFGNVLLLWNFRHGLFKQYIRKSILLFGVNYIVTETPITVLFLKVIGIWFGKIVIVFFQLFIVSLLKSYIYTAVYIYYFLVPYMLIVALLTYFISIWN